MERARIAKIKLAADVEIEGLLLPNGEFAVAVTQIRSICVYSGSPEGFNKYVKSLLGSNSSLVKVSSELNAEKVNIVTLKDFTRILLALATKGNQVAEQLLEIHIEASFTSIFSSAFGVKFTQEQLTQWVEARETHKKTFPLLTRWLKEDGCDNYGKAVNIFKAKAGLPRLTVDDYTKDELFQANAAERMYDRLRIKGMDHDAALDLL